MFSSIRGRRWSCGDRAFRAFKAEHPDAKDVKSESFVLFGRWYFPLHCWRYRAAGRWLNGDRTDARSERGGLPRRNTPAKVAAVTAIRLAILNLAGVPSIVFGLFGLGLFVIYLDWNVSLLAGWFTLAFMVLPVVVTSIRRIAQGRAEGFSAKVPWPWEPPSGRRFAARTCLPRCNAGYSDVFNFGNCACRR